jgi:cell division protein FtsQ
VTITDPEVHTEPPASRGRSHRRLIIAGATATLVVAGAVYATGWTSVMGVNSIEVRGATVTSADQLVQTAGILEGTPMMRVDVRAATARLADLPQVASVDVVRQWPRTVVLSVTEREAVAAKKADGGWDLVDANGIAFVVSAKRPKDLPAIQPSSDELTNTAMTNALAGMSPEIRSKVAKVSADSPVSITLLLRKSGAVVQWGSPDGSQEKSDVLAVLLSTDAGWYDVSNPNTPSTADAPPVVAPPDVAESQAPTAEPSPPATPTPTPTPSAPTQGEVPVGVVPD